MYEWVAAATSQAARQSALAHRSPAATAQSFTLSPKEPSLLQKTTDAPRHTFLPGSEQSRHWFCASQLAQPCGHDDDDGEGSPLLPAPRPGEQPSDAIAEGTMSKEKRRKRLRSIEGI